jgi:SAM-dependent methyltransferase
MSFDEAFARVERSPWLRTWFGPTLDRDLPAEVEPFSFVPLAGLREVATALRIRPGQTLVDLACGRGGPGMWLAQETGAVLTGVDGSAVAVARADARAGLFGLIGRARFVVGDLARTGLPDAHADGVVCIDSFQFAPDPIAAAREVRRLLRPGGRCVLTTWEPRQLGDVELPERFRNLDLAQVLTAAGSRVRRSDTAESSADQPCAGSQEHCQRGLITGVPIVELRLIDFAASPVAPQRLARRFQLIQRRDDLRITTEDPQSGGREPMRFEVPLCCAIG